MREYYERYRRSPRRETNNLIDAPVLFLKGFTKSEILAGVLLFVGSIYVSAFSMLLSLAFMALAYLSPFGLRGLRLRLPRNAFYHLLWFLGLWNGSLPAHFRRPKHTRLVL